MHYSARFGLVFTNSGKQESNYGFNFAMTEVGGIRICQNANKSFIYLVVLYPWIISLEHYGIRNILIDTIILLDLHIYMYVQKNK